MFSKTDKVYASAKHSVIRDMCVDPDELVFTLARSLFLFLKKDFLNSPTKIFFKNGDETFENNRHPARKDP